MTQPNNTKNDHGDLLLQAVQSHRTGDLRRAEQLYREYLQAEPMNAEAWGYLGVLALQEFQYELAVNYLSHALSLAPATASFHGNIACAFEGLGRIGEAATHYQQALILQPEYPEALNNLGGILLDNGKVETAIQCFLEAIRLNRNYADAYENLGLASEKQGRFSEAREYTEKALLLNPNSITGHNKLGAILLKQGFLTQAMKEFDASLVRRHNYAEARVNRALALLQMGRFEEGWSEMRWRQSLPGLQQRPLTKPLWDGSDLHGKTILLHIDAALGLGDAIQFVRYAALAKERGGTVILECHGALQRLFARLPEIDQVLVHDAPLPPFDVHAPILLMPNLLQTTLGNVPARVPYLHAEPQLVEHWRRELASLRGFKIGIIWEGRESNPDRQRSIPLGAFGRLAALEGVCLISLQKGTGTEQLASLAGRIPVLDLGNRLDEANGPFMDTAAIMQNLDLVIASDTAPPHLAGALGVRVWLGLARVADWRWLLEREDSPWYPTMRLFRQTVAGRWDDVFERMARELEIRILDQTAH